MRRTYPCLFFGGSSGGNKFQFPSMQDSGQSSPPTGGRGNNATDMSSGLSAALFGGNSHDNKGVGGQNPLAMMMDALSKGLPKDLSKPPPPGAAGGNPFAMMKDFFEVREWECWCGHKFRAPGQWAPCGPMQCMAPGCPNPKFFETGEGRKMLDSGRSGPLPSRSISDK